MELWILFGSFTILLLIGMPVAFCLGVSSLLTVLYMDLPPIIVFQQITTPGVADPHRVGVAFDTLEWPTGPEADWYMAGMKGAWMLTYGGPTQ